MSYGDTREYRARARRRIALRQKWKALGFWGDYVALRQSYKVKFDMDLAAAAEAADRDMSAQLASDRGLLGVRMTLEEQELAASASYARVVDEEVARKGEKEKDRRLATLLYAERKAERERAEAEVEAEPSDGGDRPLPPLPFERGGKEDGHAFKPRRKRGPSAKNREAAINKALRNNTAGGWTENVPEMLVRNPNGGGIRKVDRRLEALSGEALEQMRGRRAPTHVNIEFVADNTNVAEVDWHECPSRAAWNLLSWVRKSEGFEADFWRTMYPKLIMAKAALEQENRGREDEAEQDRLLDDTLKSLMKMRELEHADGNGEEAVRDSSEGSDREPHVAPEHAAQGAGG